MAQPMQHRRDLENIIESTTLMEADSEPPEYTVVVKYTDGTSSQHDFRRREEAHYFQDRLRKYESLSAHRAAPMTEKEYVISRYELSSVNHPSPNVFIDVVFTHNQPGCFTVKPAHKRLGPYESFQAARDDVLWRFTAPEVAYTIMNAQCPPPNKKALIKFRDGGIDFIGPFDTEVTLKLELLHMFPKARENGTMNLLKDDPAIALYRMPLKQDSTALPFA